MMMNALINDNQEIIRKHLSEISRSNRTYYYIDNKVYGCIYEIAEKEGRPDLIPKDNETLSEWRERPGRPCHAEFVLGDPSEPLPDLGTLICKGTTP